MKKIFLFILIVISVIITILFLNKSNDKEFENSLDLNENITVEEQLLYDEEGITIKLKDMIIGDEYDYAILFLDITNNSKYNNVSLMFRNQVVNDVCGDMNQQIPLIEVMKGETLENKEYYVYLGCFSYFDETTLYEIEFDVITMDSLMNYLVEKKHISIKTSEYDNKPEKTKDIGTFVNKKDSMGIYGLKFDTYISLRRKYGAYFLFDNSNNKYSVDLEFSEVKINGERIDYWIQPDIRVPWNSKCIFYIEFDFEDLYTKKIDEIESISFSLKLRETDDLWTVSQKQLPVYYQLDEPYLIKY